jgi:predicted XRE-type DNA-binding protein
VSGATVRGKFRPARAVLAKAEVQEPPGAARARSHAERKARQLALAYAIERAIEAGEFRSYGEVARALGITQPRVSQVMALMLLPPALQERVLLGDLGVGIRGLAREARKARWEG